MVQMDGNFWPVDFWPDDFWPDASSDIMYGIVDNLSTTIAAMQTGASPNSIDWSILDNISSTMAAI